MAHASTSEGSTLDMTNREDLHTRAGIRTGRVWVGLLALAALGEGVAAQQLDLPERNPEARLGTSVVNAVTGLTLEAREDVLVEEVLSGNVPAFLRTFVRVEMRAEFEGRDRLVVLQVLPDVLAVGSSQDFVRIPLSPHAAQAIADRTYASLPTSRISDAIWSSATLRMPPQPIPPSDAMTTVRVSAEHHALIEALWPAGLAHGTPVAGIKKDVVLTPRLEDEPGRVAIYGWHGQDGSPIQPVYTGHTDRWVDYSHGIRLVSRRVVVDGVEHDLVDLLEDPELWQLVSDEGPMHSARYATSPR